MSPKRPWKVAPPSLKRDLRTRGFILQNASGALLRADFLQKVPNQRCILLPCPFEHCFRGGFPYAAPPLLLIEELSNKLGACLRVARVLQHESIDTIVKQRGDSRKGRGDHGQAAGQRFGHRTSAAPRPNRCGVPHEAERAEEARRKSIFHGVQSPRGMRKRCARVGRRVDPPFSDHRQAGVHRAQEHASERGITRFAATSAVLNSWSSDESATAKRLPGVCGS